MRYYPDWQEGGKVECSVSRLENRFHGRSTATGMQLLARRTTISGGGKAVYKDIGSGYRWHWWQVTGRRESITQLVRQASRVLGLEKKGRENRRSGWIKEGDRRREGRLATSMSLNEDEEREAVAGLLNVPACSFAVLLLSFCCTRPASQRPSFVRLRHSLSQSRQQKARTRVV